MHASKLNVFAQVRELSSPADIVFACALMQRMLPSYITFSRTSGFGCEHTATAILNTVWEWCMSRQNKFNAEAQLDKLEDIVPDVDNFELFAVYPALDFCMALSAVLQSFVKQHDHPAVTVAKLSQGSVEALILAQSDTQLDNAAVKQDPLMQYEIGTAQSLLTFLHENPVDKTLVKSLRKDIVDENVSNLGLSL